MAKEAARNRLVVHPEEAEVVRLIYELYLANFGAKSIAERLNKQGQLYRGRPWSKNRILDIIGDESYVGRYYFNKKESKTHKPKPREEWIEIPVEPIIDLAAWEKARALKQQRYPQDARTNPAVEVSKTLLTGLAVCGLCGRSMTLECGKGGSYTYYNCSGYFRSGKSTCRGQRIPAAALEQAVLHHLTEKLFTKERVKALLKRIYDDLKTLGARNDNLRKSLQKQLEGTQARLKPAIRGDRIRSCRCRGCGRADPRAQGAAGATRNPAGRAEAPDRDPDQVFPGRGARGLSGIDQRALLGE